MFFSEKEFKELGERLRNHTDEATRIEIAAWAKPYTVDVKDVHTELTLVTEPKGQQVSNYKQLFLSGMATEPKALDSHSMKKILIKGRQGFGKSSFAKKILFDWSKGMLTEFEIVFLVSMKLVMSDYEIENAIVQQVQPLNDLNIASEKLGVLLDNFGSRCLIVLDSFGEDSENINKMLKSIRSRCSILVTSLPETPSNFDQCFDTVAEIQALRENQVKQYVGHVQGERSHFTFDPKVFVKNYIPNITSPLLILFFSIIGDSSEFERANLADIGEVYFKLVQCLCYKVSSSCITSSGLESLIKMGKIALRGLNRNQYCFLKRDVDEELNEEELKTVFMVSHEGFSRSGDSNVDGTVSFVHSVFQYYFAFLYFILTYTDIITEIGSMSAFLTLPNFCNFCLQLLRTDTEIDGSEMRARAYTRLQLLFVEKMNHVNFHLNKALKNNMAMSSGFKKRNSFIGELVQSALSMCNNIRHIILDNAIDFELQCFQPIWQQLLSVQLLYRKYTPKFHPQSSCQDLVFITDTPIVQEMKNLVDAFKGTGKKLYLYYLGNNLIDSLSVSEFAVEYLQELHVNPPMRSKLKSKKDFDCAKKLTRLSLCNMEIDDSVYYALSNAIMQGQMPKLIDLSLAGSTVKGQLNRLFKPNLKWPCLVHLDLNRCTLTQGDVRALEIAGMGSLLPRLRSLSVDCSDIDITPLLLVLPQIRVLHLQPLSKIQYKLLVTFLNAGMLPKLTELECRVTNRWTTEHLQSILGTVAVLGVATGWVTSISDIERWQINSYWTFILRLLSKEIAPVEHIHITNLDRLSLNEFVSSATKLYAVARCAKFSSLFSLDISHSSGISGRLFILVSYSLPKLKTLILSNCRLISDDLISLAKANIENKMPSLRHLDISGNWFEYHHTILSMFGYNAKWESLISLCVQHNSPDWWTCLGSRVQLGCLGSLQELSVNGKVFKNHLVLWRSLRKLNIYGCENESECKQFLLEVKQLVQNAMCPRLDTVLVSLYYPGSDAAELDIRMELMSLGVYVRIEWAEAGIPWLSLRRRKDSMKDEPSGLHSSESIVSPQYTGGYICFTLVKC